MNENLEFLHLCDSVLIDKANKLSIIGIFTTLNFKELPATHPTFTVVGSIIPQKTEDNGPRIISLKVIDPDGEEIVNLESSKLTDQINRGDAPVGFTFTLNTMKFEKAEKHQVEVRLDGDLIGVKEFEVVVRD